MQALETVSAGWKHTITLSALPKDGTAYIERFYIEEASSISYWGQLYSFTKPINAEVKIYRAEGNLYTDITMSGEVETSCGRCLEPAKTEFEGELKYLFSLSADAENLTREEQEGNADGDEDIIVLDSWEDEIDLSPQLWEVTLTALPAVILCKPDCKGLCPQCGANLNSEKCSCTNSSGDARFEVLRQLMEDK